MNPPNTPAATLVHRTSPFESARTSTQGRQRLIDKWSLFSADVLALLLAWLLMVFESGPSHVSDLVLGLNWSEPLAFITLTVSWFWLVLGHYDRRRPYWTELQEIVRVLFCVGVVSGAAAYAMDLPGSKRMHMLSWAISLFSVPAGRALVRRALSDLGCWLRPIMIVGTGENARDAWRAVRQESSMGFELLGFINPAMLVNAEQIEVDGRLYPVHSLQGMEPTLAKVDVVVALDSLVDTASQVMVQRILSLHRNVHLVPALRGLPLFGTQLAHFFSHDVLLLTLRNNLSRKSYRWLKRVFDLVVGFFLVLLLSPLFVYLIWRVRQDGGNAFYGHVRVGQNGKSFRCLKFRSMRSDSAEVLRHLLKTDPAAKSEWESDFKLKNDPRITKVGHFLRKTSLDELPQLFNVLNGEMSLVGPRPVVQEELSRYGAYQHMYLQVRPGMTGLWQVSGRNNTTYEKRVALDTWYVQNWSPWYDVAILFKTVDVVLNQRGAY